MSETSRSITHVKSANKKKTHTGVMQGSSSVPWYRARPMLSVAVIVILLAFSWTYMLIHTETHKTLDQRVRDVASQLKCPICQGESVADSPSGLAQQMRGVIRQQLQEGKSEQEVIQYFINSYGSQIIWSPPWQGFSLLAWLVPIAMFIGGVILVFFVMRDWHVAAITPTSTDAIHDPPELDEAELEQYRQQLEEELAEEDSLFWHEEGKR
jgi:cytochrome c-type biogenesis protein CcmH